MNHYTELLRYLKELADKDVFINTVTQGSIDEAFLNKGDIYPLLHIDITGGGFTNGSTVKFNVELTCVNVRDYSKKVNKDKFYNDENAPDNFNETHAVLNRIWSIMYRDFEDRDITTDENASLEKVTFDYANLVDGWQLPFEVEIPNTTISLCS